MRKFRLYNFIANYRQVWLLFLLLSIVGIAGVYFRQQRRLRQEIELVESLAVVQRLIEEGEYEKALKGEEGIFSGLEEIVKSAKGFRVANLTYLYSGLVYMQKKDCASAISYFLLFDLQSTFLQASVLALIGDCYSKEGKYEAAIEYYEKASACNPNPHLTPSYLIKAAQLYELQKKYLPALSCYEKIVTMFPSSSSCKIAKKHVARLKMLVDFT